MYFIGQINWKYPVAYAKVIYKIELNKPFKIQKQGEPQCYFCNDIVDLKVVIPTTTVEEFVAWGIAMEKWVSRRCFLLVRSPIPVK